MVWHVLWGSYLGCFKITTPPNPQLTISPYKKSKEINHIGVRQLEIMKKCVPSLWLTQ